MQKFFQYIRRQPKSSRDNYAFGIAITFTALVLMVWVVARPSGENFVGVVSDEALNTSPFATLIKETKEKFAGVKDSVAQTVQSESDSQAAALTSATTSVGEIILNEEDLEKARLDMELSASTSKVEEKPKGIYSEVLIGTTSASVLIPNKGETASVTASTTGQ
jgi:hypothetical protein